MAKVRRCFHNGGRSSSLGPRRSDPAGSVAIRAMPFVFHEVREFTPHAILSLEQVGDSHRIFLSKKYGQMVAAYRNSSAPSQR